MMTILVALLLAGQAAFLLPSLYLLFLTLAGLFARSTTRVDQSPATRFAILVPAHNEVLLLPKLLESLDRLEYPKDLYDVYVVADNCTDTTAEVARDGGATVFERQNRQEIGKGYALRWLMEQLSPLGQRHDACLLLDADAEVSSNFLAVMDRKFRTGSRVVQGYYTVSNATQTPVSALRFMALALMHYARPRGRQALGLSCGLFGTGMAFRKDVLDRYGWNAFTLAEDVEYYLKLTDQGIKVDFAAEAVQWAQMPDTYKDAKSQNLRWERGRLQMAWRYGVRFCLEGVIKGNPVKLDAGVQQLIPPLSVIVIGVLALLLLSIPTGRVWLIALGVTTLLALLGHLFLGLFAARVPWTAYRFLAYLPGFALWKLVVYAQALLPGQMSWTRTNRS